VAYFFFQAEDGIRDATVTGVQTCALPILVGSEPERNSAVLFIPSPSASALASASGQLVQPKYWSCQDWNDVITRMRLFDISVLRSEERRVGKEGRTEWAVDN